MDSKVFQVFKVKEDGLDLLGLMVLKEAKVIKVLLDP
jgi:hypothetical protein